MTESGVWAGIRDRSIAQVMLVYAAGAWAVVEVVGFFTATYGWPRRIVDVSVLLAMAGGAVALTLAWYHGKAGRQEIATAEKVILGIITTLTVCAGAALILRDPARRFEELDGHRIIVEFPVLALNDMKFAWRPEEGNFATDDGIVLLTPEWAEFSVPGVELRSMGAPVRLHYQDLERPRISALLPQRPRALQVIRSDTTLSEPLVIETMTLILRVQGVVLIRPYPDSTLVIVEPPLAGHGS